MAKLTSEQIKALLTKPEKTKSSTGKVIDASQRDSTTWFKLAHKLFDEETQETAKCSNPNCCDPRGGKGAVVATVSGVKMCRYCFLDGYMLEIEGQTSLVNND